jgi:hypothetical protein
MLMVLAMSAAAPAWAQLIVDPAALPLPDSTEPDPARAVVVSVTFNSPTEVVTNMVMVANRGARSALGAPPLILLQLLDSNDNVIAEQDAWHPLEVRDLNEGDGESLEAVESGPGTFYVILRTEFRSHSVLDVQGWV